MGSRTRSWTIAEMKIEAETWRCLDCDQTFKTRSDLDDHQNKTHLKR